MRPEAVICIDYMDNNSTSWIMTDFNPDINTSKVGINTYLINSCENIDPVCSCSVITFENSRYFSCYTFQV